MTPQLRQAIEMLQLNNMELSALVEKEFEQNPFLEKDDSPAEGNDDGPSEQETTPSDDMQTEFDNQFDGSSSDFDSGATQYGGGGSGNFEQTEGGFEERLSDEKSLRDHLLEQLHIACDDPRDQMIGAYLIDDLDESGYLRDPPEALLERLGCSQERLDKLLDILRGFDPTGIFARDLPDCLALQLQEQGKLDEPMAALLKNLDLLGKHDLEKLQQICAVNETYLADMIAEIRTLNPKPAGDFEHFISQTAIPDVLMKKLPKHVGGGWRVELNHETLPRVLVNQEYHMVVANSAVKAEDKTYLNNQMTAANWLVRALDQRAQTILKVAGPIIEEHDAFFLFGV